MPTHSAPIIYLGLRWTTDGLPEERPINPADDKLLLQPNMRMISNAQSSHMWCNFDCILYLLIRTGGS